MTRSAGSANGRARAIVSARGRVSGAARAKTRVATAAALILGALLMLAGCGGSGADNGTGSTSGVDANAIAKGESGDTYTAPKVEPSGTVSVSTDKPFFAYNNATAAANNSYNVYALTQVLASAFILDGHNKVLLDKDVMDSVDVTSQNPFTVTWHIRPGVTWSDGAPWGCADFYLAWLAQSEQDLTPDGKSTYFLPAATNGYRLITTPPKCVDDHTFVTVFSQPYPDYPGLFGNSLDLLPAHILEQRTGIADITTVTPHSPPDVLRRVADFWNTGWKGFTKALMPASGPYLIDSWDQNQSVTLVRNPRWIGNPGGPAKIVLKAISDPSAQVQALQNGENQVMASAQPDGNAAAQLRALAAQGIVYGAAAGLNFEHIDLNLRNPVLADKAVRQAVFQCVNREDLVSKLIKPVQPDAKPAGSLLFLPTDSGYQNVYSAESTGNADQARQTLTADGWRPGADGIMVRNGLRLSFKISHTDIPRRKQTVQLVQSQCRAAGIDVQDDTDPNFLDTRVSTGQWDAALFTWSEQPFKSAFQSIYTTGGGQNWGGLHDPVVDQAFSQAVVQLSAAQAQPYYQRADQALAQDYYSLPLFLTPQMWAYKGIDRVYMQGYYGALWNANEWVATRS